MPQLTPQDIHEAYNQTHKSNPKSRSLLTEWEDVTPYSQDMYERMAQLLNEKLQQPLRWVATAKIGGHRQFTVILATSELGESDAIEKALDAIYESGLDDITKDQLRNTLSVGKES